MTKIKIGDRVRLCGLEAQGDGVVTKIGRDRATVKLDIDTPAIDAIGRAKRPAKDWAFKYNNLRKIVPDNIKSGSEDHLNALTNFFGI